MGIVISQWKGSHVQNDVRGLTAIKMDNINLVRNRMTRGGWGYAFVEHQICYGLRFLISFVQGKILPKFIMGTKHYINYTSLCLLISLLYIHLHTKMTSACIHLSISLFICLYDAFLHLFSYIMYLHGNIIYGSLMITANIY